MANRRYGLLRDLPPEKRVLARSVERSERAVDRVMAGLSDRIVAQTRAIIPEGQPVTDAQVDALLAAIDRELDGVYGRTRKQADTGQMGRVIVQEAHTTRRDTATAIMAKHLLPAARRDPDLREAMGITEEEARGRYR